MSFTLLVGKKAPEFSGIDGWINSQPLTLSGLKGRVVMLDFWTFDCFNCINTRPHMNRLNKMFVGNKFVMIGVHTPEFDFEKVSENVMEAVKQYEIVYPVALDTRNVTWKLYGNQYWPRHTLIDAKGNVRWEHVGEGDYDEMENMIRQLIKEAEHP